MKTKKVSKKTPSKAPILSLSKIEEKELTIDSVSLAKLESLMPKTDGDISLSDVVTSLLLEKGSNGFKFKVEKPELKKIKLTMPKAAWDIAEKSAQKSGATLSDVVEKLSH